MAQFFHVHPDNPQPRLIRQAVALLRGGAVVVYPTDSSYALGCAMGEKTAMDRIRQIRRVGSEHNFTLVFNDLSAIGLYAKLENQTFRILKSYTPGPYTFIVPATREVPRRMQHPRRRTIGLRIPEAAVPRALVDELGEALMSSTLIFPGDTDPCSDPEIIRERLEHEVELIIDGGAGDLVPTTVVDLTGEPRVLRRGKGDAAPFE